MEPINIDYSDALFSTYLKRLKDDPSLNVEGGKVLLFGRAGNIDDRRLCNLAQDFNSLDLDLVVIEFIKVLSGSVVQQQELAALKEDNTILPAWGCPGEEAGRHFIVQPTPYALDLDRQELFERVLDDITRPGTGG